MTRTHTTLTLTVEFLSDWHVGSGLERPGSVDRLVQRDEDDFPFLPAKTLTGMLRDAAEQAARALDEGSGDRWYRWVHWLFGDQPARANDDPREMLRHECPTDAAMSVRPARFPESLRKALSDDRSRQLDPRRRELREALVFAKPGVKIERNGRAADNTLRLDEMARVGVSLDATVVLDDSGLNGEQRTFALNLLALATTFVERLGGKRRRGAGRVALTLRGKGVADRTALADWLEQTREPPALPKSSLSCAQEADAKTAFGGAATESEWVVYPFRVTLKTPLLVAERTLGNVVKSLDFVPGTYLLPIVRRALQPHLSTVAEAIAAGDVRVSPATIEIDSERGLPVPAALFHAKGEEHGFERNQGVSNGLIHTHPDHVKDFRDGYIVPEAPDAARLPRFGKPSKVVRPHNTVQDASQRPTTDVGGVFSYEAIAPVDARTRTPTVFRGEIRLRKSLADALGLSEWWKSLSGSHSLGRSKKDDYGQTTIVCDGKPLDSTRPFTDCAAGGTHTIWLVSDALLAGDRLDAEPTLAQLVDAVAAALGVRPCDVEVDARGPRPEGCGPTASQVERPADAPDGDPRDKKLPAAFLRHRRIESWHVGWGLPRPSLVCLAAGSCVRLRFAVPVDGAKLAALEAEGIGLRRAEGYGMLRIDDPLLDADVSRWKGRERPDLASMPPLPTITDPSESVDLAQRMERECWRRRIRQAALAKMGSPELRKKLLGLESRKPKPAQAGLMRSLLRMGIGDAAPSPLVDPLRALQAKNERDPRWPPAALDRIVELLTDENVVWRKLGAFDEQWPWPQIVAEERGQLIRRELWPEAVRTLIEAALKAHQRDAEKSVGVDHGA